jgi:hypothetical protein
MKFSTYGRIKLNALKSYIDAVKRLGKMEPLAEETKGVSQVDLNTGSSKFQQFPLHRTAVSKPFGDAAI